jgi:hypothetical protein
MSAEVTGGGDASAAKQDALAALVGEAQATPTDNTVLDRLKDIADKLISADDSVIYIGGTAYTPKWAVIHCNTSGDNTVVAAVTSKKIRVVKYSLVVAGAMTVRWESGASGTALTGQMSFAANGGISEPFTPTGLFETAAGALLNLELSAATYADGVLQYIEV